MTVMYLVLDRRPPDAHARLHFRPPPQVAVTDAKGGPHVSLRTFFSDRLTAGLPDNDSIGDYCVAAELWPSQKLRTGAAAASEALGAMLGSPASGRIVTLYPLPSESSAVQPCGELALRLCSDPTGLGNSLLPRAPADAEEPAPGTPTPASPAQRGREGSPGMMATPPSMRGAASSQGTPNLLPPKEPRTGKKKSGAGPRAASEAATEDTAASHVSQAAQNSTHLAVVQDLLKGKCRR